MEQFNYEFQSVDKVKGIIETLSPYLKSIPEASRAQFVDEYASEFKNLYQKETGKENLVWNAECLVVVLRKN